MKKKRVNWLTKLPQLEEDESLYRELAENLIKLTSPRIEDGEREMKIWNIVKQYQKDGAKIKISFKDNSSFYILEDDDFEFISDDFVMLSSTSLTTGKKIKTIRNIREIRSIDLL